MTAAAASERAPAEALTLDREILVLGGRFPAESGYTTAFAMSGAAAIVALLVTFAIPAREAPVPAAQPAREPVEARA